MVIWPRVVSYSSVDLGVWISSTFGAELPYRPVGAMFVIEEFDKGVCGITIRSLRVGRGRARCSDDWQQIELLVWIEDEIG